MMYVAFLLKYARQGSPEEPVEILLIPRIGSYVFYSYRNDTVYDQCHSMLPFCVFFQLIYNSDKLVWKCTNSNTL